MADTNVFDCVCEVLEQETSLDRLEARGTVRLALKSAGFNAKSVTPEQMKVILERVLPEELSSRGIDAPDAAVHAACERLAGIQVDAIESPESVFARLAG